MHISVIGKNTFYYNEQSVYHREDGPAIEYANGYKSWIVNGIYHRLDGPALHHNNVGKYYIMGKQHSYEDWLAIKDYPLLW